MSELPITINQLDAYLDDAVNQEEAARIEQAIREYPELQQEALKLLQNRDRGQHTIGAIWRREQLTCPSQEEIRLFILEGLDDNMMDYLEFHLETLECPQCKATYTALKDSSNGEEQERQQRIFKGSTGTLPPHQED